jgi:hypothetical protein
VVGVPCPKAWTPLALLVSDSGSVQAHPFVCTVTIKVLTHLESLVGLVPTLFGIKFDTLDASTIIKVTYT